MALIKHLDKKTIERPSLHDEATGGFAIIDHGDGRKFLQIDTYGREGRKLEGKISQSLQFGPEGIQQLKKILNEF